jgi:hypothetical protein
VICGRTVRNEDKKKRRETCLKRCSDPKDVSGVAGVDGTGLRRRERARSLRRKTFSAPRNQRGKRSCPNLSLDHSDKGHQQQRKPHGAFGSQAKKGPQKAKVRDAPPFNKGCRAGTKPSKKTFLIFSVDREFAVEQRAREES